VNPPELGADGDFGVPALRVPEGRLFTYPTRLVETWAPAVEEILLGPYELGGSPGRVTVAPGETGSSREHVQPRLLRAGSRWRNRARMSIERLAAGGAQEVDGLVHDGRQLHAGNMAHILCEIGPRFLCARKLLIARDGAERMRLAVQSGLPPWALEAFELLGIELVPTDARLRGRLVGVSAETLFPLLPWIHDADFRGRTDDTPAKVFLSRRNTRTLLNEDEVWTYLKEKGYTRWYFEDVSVALQWSVLRNAADVVAVHGAAIAALVFRRPTARARLVELLGPGWIPNYFRSLAAAVGADWAGVRGQITPEVVRDLDHRSGRETRHELAPFRVSLDSLERALRHVADAEPPQ
jgi:hypothetical protein